MIEKAHKVTSDVDVVTAPGYLIELIPWRKSVLSGPETPWYAEYLKFATCQIGFLSQGSNETRWSSNKTTLRPEKRLSNTHCQLWSALFPPSCKSSISMFLQDTQEGGSSFVAYWIKKIESEQQLLYLKHVATIFFAGKQDIMFCRVYYSLCNSWRRHCQWTLVSAHMRMLIIL